VIPETRYAKSGAVHIAYQAVGDGPTDLVLITGLFSHIEHQWEEPSFARFLERLASFSRLIVFDARGAGLSDRAPELPPLEEQMDDVLTVLDAAGSASAAFFGVSQAGPMAMLFAASFPERTRALVLYGSYARPRAADGYPWGRTTDWMDDYARLIDDAWGTGMFLSQVAPSRVDDEAFRAWWSRYERLSYGPGNALAYFRMNAQIDVRPILPTIRTPTLVLQRRDDVYRDAGQARYLADNIPGAKLVELSGVDHLPYLGDSGAVLDEVRSSSPASGRPPSTTASSRRSSSPTSSSRPSGPAPWGTAHGKSCSSGTMPWSVTSLADSGVARLIRPAMDSSRPSTGRRERCDVPRRSWASCARSGSKSARVCIRARSSSWTPVGSAESQCTSGRGSPPRPVRARSSSPGR
jgi:pimeloyl-ACP methyl ester carboxylesterase